MKKPKIGKWKYGGDLEPKGWFEFRENSSWPGYKEGSSLVNKGIEHRLHYTKRPKKYD